MPALLVLAGRTEREKAHRWIDAAPVNARVTFAKPKRSLAQNDRLWAHLTDIAAQRKWHGQTLSTDDWKLLFMSALKQEMRLVPNLDGNGFVQLGRSSSALDREEMAGLITIIEAWAAREGVTLGDEIRSEEKGAAEKAALTAA